MNKVKAILLNGNKVEEILLNAPNTIGDALKILGVDELQGYHTFGGGYTMLWQDDFLEDTSMEITMYAGATYPIFIDSKVVIINEDVVKEESIDVDIDDVKRYFNTKNAFWALMRNYIK